jgi:hypothetical protein
MFRRHRHAHRALSLLLAALTLPAQDRVPIVGRVLDDRGQPMAGATVTLVWDQPDVAGLVEPDVVVAKTDERGRFVGNVLRGVGYFAFAVGLESNGKALVSQLQRDLGPGRANELTCTQKGRRRRAKLDDLDVWGGPPAVRAQLTLPGLPAYRLPIAIDDSGRVELPPIAEVTRFELTDRDGGVLCWTVPGGAAVPVGASKVRVRVVDDKGQPVAGAAVLVRHDWGDGGYRLLDYAGRDAFCRRAGVTGADGTLEVMVSCDQGDPFVSRPQKSIVLLAQKEGFAEGASGWLEGTLIDWRIGGAHEKGEVRIALEPAQPFALRLVGANLAGRTVRLLALGLAASEHGSMYLPRTYDVAVAADGSVSVPCFPRHVGRTMLVVPPDGALAPLLLPLQSHEAGVVDLGQVQPLTLEVLDERKGPAAGAAVLLVPRDGDTIDIAHAPALVPDAAGKVEVRMQPGRWNLLAVDRTGWAELALDELPANKRLSVQLEPKPAKRVRIVDAQGRPLAGACMSITEFRTDYTKPATGLDNIREQLGYNLLSRELWQPTDARGETVVHFLPLPRTTIRVFAIDQNQRSDPFWLTATEGDEVTTVKIGK